MGVAPPKPMTWKKAFVPLSAAVLFDVLRYACLGLILFAPSFLNFYVSAKTGSSALGMAAEYTFGITEPFIGTGAMLLAMGVILSIAVTILGILFILTFLIITNPRIFKENVAHPPLTLFGVLASLAVMTGMLYRTQIKNETKKYETWEKKNKAAIQAEQEEKLARLVAARQASARAQLQETQEQDEAEAAQEEEGTQQYQDEASPEYA